MITIMDAADLREFYSSRLGTVTRRLLSLRLRRHWPSVNGCAVLGLGFALPYLDLFRAESERVFGFMPARRGVMHWPQDGPSATALVGDTELPLLDGSLDRVLCIHSLELADDPASLLREVWRVLTPQGRALIVTPNRRGMWARFDSTPFGYGQPYSRPQLQALLKDADFMPAAWSQALFIPPFSGSLILSSATAIERAGSWTSPAFSGVILVEAIKQVYAVSGGKRQRRLAYRLRPAPAPALQSQERPRPR